MASHLVSWLALDRFLAVALRIACHVMRTIWPCSLRNVFQMIVLSILVGINYRHQPRFVSVVQWCLWGYVYLQVLWNALKPLQILNFKPMQLNIFLGHKFHKLSIIFSIIPCKKNYTITASMHAHLKHSIQAKNGEFIRAAPGRLKHGSPAHHVAQLTQGQTLLGLPTHTFSQGAQYSVQGATVSVARATHPDLPHK